MMSSSSFTIARPPPAEIRTSGRAALGAGSTMRVTDRLPGFGVSSPAALLRGRQKRSPRRMQVGPVQRRGFRDSSGASAMHPRPSMDSSSVGPFHRTPLSPLGFPHESARTPFSQSSRVNRRVPRPHRLARGRVGRVGRTLARLRGAAGRAEPGLCVLRIVPRRRRPGYSPFRTVSGCTGTPLLGLPLGDRCMPNPFREVTNGVRRSDRNPGFS